tara:strand:+ start:2641 stop:4731 length:2091 start_codon:yes stop_codon:yes gene_type:complete
LYHLAGKRYGLGLVKYNILLCDRHLKTDNANSEIVSPWLRINDYFDNVYVVNLKNQVENRLKVSHHLNEYGLNFQLFAAVNGYQGVPLKTYDEYKARELGSMVRYSSFNQKEIERGKPFIESAGAVGYIFTHIKILKDAKEKGYKRILILEDDVILSHNLRENLDEFIQAIPNNWKVLQLGAAQYNWASVEEGLALRDGYYHPRRLDTCGSFAIAFDASVYDDLIEAESALEAPFDHLPLGEIYEKYLGKCFVAFPNIVTPCVAESSIRGGRCQVTHGKKMKWQIDSFDYPLGKPTIALLISSKESLKYFSSFSSKIEQPFVPNLFIKSEDGFRALHNPEIMSYPYNQVNEISSLCLLPKHDYYAEVSDLGVVTESDIINFLEYKNFLLVNNISCLKDIDIQEINGVKGRVSVLIPTYKRPANLKHALTSVAQQEYDDIEIIVVCDNGQTSEYNEETKIIVEEIQKTFSSVIIKLIFHKYNRNGAAARNTGFINSSGEFICLLDDDDMYLPGRLSESISVLQSTSKKIGGVYCGFLGWNSPENNLKRYIEGNLTLEILQLDYKKHYLHTNTATYKREAYVNLNGFDEFYRRHQDLEFNLRFFEMYEMKAVRQALVRLNPEPSDISNKVFNNNMFELKNKFLKQFDKTIDSYGEDVSKAIYEKHWEEVIRYIDDPSIFGKTSRDIHKNGLRFIERTI